MQTAVDMVQDILLLNEQFFVIGMLQAGSVVTVPAKYTLLKLKGHEFVKFVEQLNSDSLADVQKQSVLETLASFLE
jgi:hypothetical protein